jgi:hypothetical protein
LVLRHQMERGFVTRLLQHGPVLVERGAAGAARSIGLLQHGPVLADTGEQDARGPIGFAPPQGARIVDPPMGAGGNRRIGNPRSLERAYPTRCCNIGRAWTRTRWLLTITHPPPTKSLAMAQRT